MKKIIIPRVKKLQCELITLTHVHIKLNKARNKRIFFVRNQNKQNLINASEVGEASKSQ